MVIESGVVPFLVPLLNHQDVKVQVHVRHNCQWQYSTVVRTSVYDRQTFLGLSHDVQFMGDLFRVNRTLYVTNVANSAIRPLGVDKWVESWSQAFAMHICVTTPPGECLRVKADKVFFAGNTVWSISECIRGIREDVLCKLTLPLSHIARCMIMMQEYSIASNHRQSVFISELQGWDV